MIIPTITTERLTLRAPRMEDFEPYAAFCASPRSVGVGGPYSEAQSFTRLAALIGHWHLRGYGRWMVTDTATTEPLGVVGLFFPAGWPEPEIAWSLFEAGEGRGIAYEAALASRAYAYETLGWKTAISCVMPDNTKSLALAKRLGATPEGSFTHVDYGEMPIFRHPAPEAA
ncbi:MAG: GNAT family N-acetyltransferase [Pseudomonadota bacterium]